MYVGQSLLVKHNGIVQKGKVEKIYNEDLDIRLSDGTLVKRKFWEIRQIRGTSYETKE